MRLDKLRTVASGLLTAVLMWLLLFAPTPYVLYEPGAALPLDSMIRSAEGKAGEASGRFLMTTVKMSSANYWRAISSLWNPDTEVYRKTSIMGDDSPEQYMSRMTVVMQGSEDVAIEAAYRYAGIPYQAVPRRVVVADVSEGSAFRTGDAIIREGGGSRIDSIEALTSIVEKAEGNSLSLIVERNGQEIAVSVKAGAVPSGQPDEAAALGIESLVEQRELVPDDSRYKIAIDAGEVGGPSAGLMFALGTLDVLTEGDLTNGLTVAGTGTINARGQVGEIGGVAHKVAAADKAGADLFLAPSANAEEAAAKAEAIGTEMRVVGVNTLDEAVQAIKTFSRSTR
ncbi:PDZ domain-containing protein [Paenibacillus thailandensis]|uniref:endopeptidase La n=1 Tax=Paenibacillus thailandensis TaxID=393250 RepID=A0ABW5QX30_9BACL